MTPLRLEPAALQSRVKHSTTELAFKKESMNSYLVRPKPNLCVRVVKALCAGLPKSFLPAYAILIIKIS